MLDEFFREYAISYATRLGWDGEWDLGKFLDKKIKTGKFVTNGKPNYNPVMLKLLGDYVLYWKDVVPLLRSNPVASLELLDFLRKTYQHVLLNGSYAKDATLLTTSGAQPQVLTLTRIEEFFAYLNIELF